MLRIINHKILFVAFFVICFLKGYGQTQKPGGANPGDSYLKNFTPKNPQSSSLGSFGKTPINYHTGLPEVSLDLMTLTSRELALPVRITYDATGVKQDDFSGPVGLKWNLEAGGFIARQMNGFPDEQPDIGFFAKESGIASFSYSNGSVNTDDIENGNIDGEPDEFVLYINGRSIKFVISNGAAVMIPHQKAKISFTLNNNKLNQFVVQMEDGNTYTFGGNATAIEERKIETMHVGLSFYYLVSNLDLDLYQGEYRIDTKDGSSSDILYSFNEVTKEFYNAKWHLVSIRSPSGDQINFTYSNDGYIRYATQPGVTRRDPMLAKTTVSKNGTPVQTYAYVKPDNSWLESGSSNDLIQSTPPFNSITLPHVSSTATSLWDPKTKIVYPGQMFVNQSLITETIIRLVSISSFAGNKLNFTSSTRTADTGDLPNAIKYDRIDLLNYSNTIIKSIKFNFATIARITQSALSSSFVETLRPNDPMWVSEALLFRCITRLRKNDNGYQRNYEAKDSDFYAEDAQYYSDSEIDNLQLSEYGLGLLKKYAYEGLKAYNFKRLYLEGITESSSGKDIPIYSFSYFQRDQVRRRLTPLQNVFGFSNVSFFGFNERYRSKITCEPPIHLPNVLAPKNETNNYAVIASSYYPDNGKLSTVLTAAESRYGILTKIVYPTLGSTEFNYNSSSYGPFLSNIEDKNENGMPARRKGLTFIATNFTPTVILNGFQNHKDDNGQRRFKIATSFPQNKSFTGSHGALRSFSEVNVYDGVNNGFEKFTFTSANDGITAIYADPVDIIDIKGTKVSTYPNPTLNPAIVFPFPKNQEKDYWRGLPDEYFLFDANNNILKYTKNNYSLNPNGFIPIDVYGINVGSYVNDNHNNRKRRYGKYKVTSEWVVLSNKEERVYNQALLSGFAGNNNYFSTKTDFIYNSANLMPSQTTSYNTVTPASKVITKTTYPLDYVTSYDPLNTLYPEMNGLHLLKENNQITTPIEVQSIIEENGSQNITSVAAFTFQTQYPYNYSKPYRVFGLNRVLPPHMYKNMWTKISTGQVILDPQLRRLHEFREYDPGTGNLLTQIGLDGIKTTYEWGAWYNSSLVTASIINPGGGILEQRTGYVHQPLVGVTGITDPNNRSSFFEYDNFGRLRVSRDHNSYITSRYRYHYLSQLDKLNPIITGATMAIVGQEAFFSTTDQIELGQTQFEWQFGDGTKVTNTSGSANKAYSAAGTYTIYANKTNPEYDPLTAKTSITIYNAGEASIPHSLNNFNYNFCDGTPSIPQLTVSVSQGCPGYSYTWQYRSIDRNGNYGNWSTFGYSATVDPPREFQSLIFDSTFEFQCIITDGCGNQITSNVISWTTSNHAACVDDNGQIK